MKNLILDTPIRHSFPDFLGKGETIIWEGEPCFDNMVHSESKKNSDEYSKERRIAFSFFAILFISYAIITKDYFAGLIYFVALLVSLNVFYLSNRKFNGHYKYAITQKQILFQFKERWWHRNHVFHSIPLSEIRDIIIIMRYDLDRIRRQVEAGNSQFHEQDYIEKGLDKIGSIIIVPHHPESIPFETRDLTNNNKRHQPSIELLENVEEVAKMIRERIRNNVK